MSGKRTYACLGLALVVSGAVLGWVLLKKPSETEAPARAVAPVLEQEQAVTEPTTRLEPNSLRNPAMGAQAEWTVVPLDGAITEQPFSVIAPDLELTRKPMGYQLAMAGQGGRMAGGSPDLPLLPRPIDGVPGMTAHAEVLSSSYREITDIDLQPVEERYRHFDLDGSTELRVRQQADEEIYGTDGFYPEDIVSVEEAWMGTQKVARIDFQPVQYNPVTRTLRYHESVSARIRYEPKPDAESVSVSFASGPAEPLDPFACPPLYPDALLPPMIGNASDFAVRRSGLPDGVDALYKIRIANGTGIYLLTRAEMIAAGIPAADIIGSQLRMFSQDEEMAVRVSKNGEFTASGDYIMFYARGYFGQHTQERAYWLGIGGTGLRMEEESSPAIGGAAEVTSHFRTLIHAPNTRYVDNRAPQNEDWDHWYVLDLYTSANPGVGAVWTHQFNFATDFPVAGGTAKICATLHGLAENDNFSGDTHNTVIRVNGNVANSGFSWRGGANFGGSPFSGSDTFPSSWLTASSAIDVRQELLPGNVYNSQGQYAGDQASLEAVSLIYPRQLRAAGDQLPFFGEEGARNYTVDGFSSSSGLWAFDLTDSVRPKRITGFTTQSTANGFSVRFGRDASSVESYRVLRSTWFKSVTSIEKTVIRGLGNPEQQADYIVICPYEFRDEAYALVTNRHLKGQSVVVAPIEDIYNEFSYGYRDATAIRQFLGYAFHHWQSPPPRSVVILGDASEDPLGFSPTSTAEDVIPTVMGGTPNTYTGLDVLSVMVNGTTTGGEADNLADMAIGRITAESGADLQVVIDKILAYEAVPFTDAFRKRALVAAGEETTSNDLGFIETANVLFTNMTNAGFTDVDKEYHGQGGSWIGVRNAINDAQGRFAAAYFGHGSHFVWNNPNYMSTSLLTSLNNTRLPIFTATTCINGYYLLPESDPVGGPDCLAEALLERPNHGAVAVVAATALSQNDAASSIAEHFYDALIEDEVHTLGEAMMAGYLGTWSDARFKTSLELVFFQIFGDPGLVVNPAP